MSNPEVSKTGFDLKDGLLVAGVVSVIGGIAHFSIAVAAIVFGLMCLVTSLKPARAASTTERQS
jgi:hypothetical protein